MHHYYESELQRICDKLLLMGQKSIEAVRSAMNALEANDGEMATRVILLDDELDQFEKAIDGECVRYISLRGPVASDVRLLTLAMKACHDLERVGDEASSIAKRVPAVNGGRAIRFQSDYLPRLTDAVLAQLQQAITCFINRDLSDAYAVTLSDKEIDELHRTHMRTVIARAEAEIGGLQDMVDIVFISKSLERVGDHAKNVAEEVIYLLEGEDVRYTDRVR